MPCFRLLLLLGAAFASAAEVVPTGAGSYLRGLPDGAKGPPVAPFVTADVRRPVPTNTWWSSLAWLPLSDMLFPHPLAAKATPAGLALGYPGAGIAANEHAIMGSYALDLTIGHAAVAEFREARVADWSDATVAARFGEPGAGFTVTLGHGLPFVYCTYQGGAPAVRFKAAPKIVREQGGELVVQVAGRTYGLYAPSNARWSGQGTAVLTAATARGDWFSAAILPDDRPATLDAFRARAHNHVARLDVASTYDPATRRVQATWTPTFVVKEPGTPGSFFARYPHQWRSATQPAIFAYASVRGPMKVETWTKSGAEGYTLPPLLLDLPVAANADRAKLRALLAQDLAGAPQLRGDTYWLGKQLGKWASLLGLAEQLGESSAAAECERRLKNSLENFLTATVDGRAKKPGEGVFAYDPRWGALIGYPASFGSDVELNDHHFHYGYFLRAAGVLARRDPAWIARWRPMVDLLARDIASGDRADPLFPYQRCFDPYAGHSWASGHGRFGDGNNQESSSESINAWYGLLVLAEATGDTRLRDRAAWLLATEVAAIEDYWFDVRGDLFPPSYPIEVVTMIWGGKGANATWFDANPQSLHGINFLPLTPGSLYLGQHPDYARRNHAGLVKSLAAFRAKQGKGVSPEAPFDHWADILWMQQATFDAPGARKAWDARPANFKPEAGNSLTFTEAWISAFEANGPLSPNPTGKAIWWAAPAWQTPPK
jgi:endoglucanase Acf2